MISFWISVVPPKIHANLFSRVEFEDATRGPGSQLLVPHQATFAQSTMRRSRSS